MKKGRNSATKRLAVVDLLAVAGRPTPSTPAGARDSSPLASGFESPTSSRPFKTVLRIPLAEACESSKGICTSFEPFGFLDASIEVQNIAPAVNQIASWSVFAFSRPEATAISSFS